LPRHEEHEYRLLEQGAMPVGYFIGSDGTIVELGWTGSPREVLASLLRQWPGRPVSLPLCSGPLLEALQGISAIPGQRRYHEHAASVTVAETSSGLWQYHQDPEGLFPEFEDAGGLLRFLREHDHVMWSIDRT
jgi:hypothetical protein